MDWVSQYVDLDYMLWIKWLMSPIIITFVILPLYELVTNFLMLIQLLFSIILLLIYISSLYLYIYKAHRKRLIRRLTEYVEQGDFWLGG